jgi:hypothetical protein
MFPRQEASQVNKSQDDEITLAALGEIIAASPAVPPELLAIARNAYAWHHIDAELAQLSFDSRYDTELSLSMRSESASVRAVTFASERFSIEVEISDGVLFGQLVPPQPGTVELRTLAGQATDSEIDELGCFTIEPKPDSQFRLRFRTQDQSDVLTGWVAP